MMRQTVIINGKRFENLSVGGDRQKIHVSFSGNEELEELAERFFSHNDRFSLSVWDINCEAIVTGVTHYLCDEGATTTLDILNLDLWVPIKTPIWTE